MIGRTHEAGGGGGRQKPHRRTTLTDPAGLALLLGSTAVMMAVALVKAQGLPFKRSRNNVPYR